jgi:hypothetical protein
MFLDLASGYQMRMAKGARAGNRFNHLPASSCQRPTVTEVACATTKMLRVQGLLRTRGPTRQRWLRELNGDLNKSLCCLLPPFKALLPT